MNAPDHSRQRQQRPLERLVPNPKLKFMEQCREAMRFHRLALRTEEAYLQWIKRFMVFHREKVEMLKVESRNGAAAQQHQTFNIEHSTSNIEHRTSNIEHRTSNIEHRTSNIEHRTFNIEHRTFNIEHRTSNIEHRTSNIEHRTSNIEHRTSNIEHRTSNIQHRTSNIEHRTSNIEHRMKAAGAGGKMGTREARPLRGGGGG